MEWDEMPARPDRSERDPKDDANAREWAENSRREAEAGKLVNDADYLAQKLAEEKRKLKRP
jgi:hypothetical protein